MEEDIMLGAGPPSTRRSHRCCCPHRRYLHPFLCITEYFLLGEASLILNSKSPTALQINCRK